jgi:hypothetical protein
MESRSDGDRERGHAVGLVSKSKREAARDRMWLDSDVSSDDLPARKCIKPEKKDDVIVNYVIEAEVEEVGDKEVEITSASIAPPAKVGEITLLWIPVFTHFSHHFLTWLVLLLLFFVCLTLLLLLFCFFCL